jgi:ferredoxin-NADP reductase
MMATQETQLVGYKAKLLSRVEVAESTMAFQFEKPPGFDFKPGQPTDRTMHGDT